MKENNQRPNKKNQEKNKKITIKRTGLKLNQKVKQNKIIKKRIRKY